MKKITKILIAVLTLCLAFALTGCSDKKAEKKYFDEVEAIQGNLTTTTSTFLTDLQTYSADVANEDVKATVLEGIKAIETEFNKLKDLSAPKKYEKAQVAFKETAEEALKGTESYRTAIENCTAEILTDETANAEFIALITEGDGYMATANTKNSEAVQLVNDANK